jgi:integrase
MSEISFHSLRHTTTSLMKNAGISPAIIQDILGHESVAISQNYGRTNEAAKRTAIWAIPALLSLI